jgi:hypothetical protein
MRSTSTHVASSATSDSTGATDPFATLAFLGV